MTNLLRLMVAPLILRSAQPTLGEHTNEVLAELGPDKIAIAALRAHGVM